MWLGSTTLGRLTPLPAKPPRCQLRASPRLPGSRASVQLTSAVRPPGPSPAGTWPRPAVGWLAADPDEPPSVWLTVTASAAQPARAAIAILVAVLVGEASIDTGPVPLNSRGRRSERRADGRLRAGAEHLLQQQARTGLG